MAAELFYLPFRPAINANGLTISGAKLHFYAAGTTTPQAVYADSSLTTPLTNPVTANSAGVWPAIYLNDALTYRVVLKDAAGVTLNDADPYLASITDTLTEELQAIASDTATDAATASSAAADAEAYATAMLVENLGTWYSSLSAGAAAVAEGEGFVVVSGGAVILGKKVGGVGVEQARFLTDTGLITSDRFEGTATDDAGTPDAVFRVNRTHNAATSPHSFRDQTVFNPTIAGIAAASFDSALTTAGAQNKDHIIAYQARNIHASSSGTLTDHTGFGSYPVVSGTATNVKHIEVKSFSGGGTVTNEYGLYVQNLTSGATNKYAIYVANNLGSVYLAAPTQVLNNDFSVGGSARLFIGPGTNAYPGIAYNYNHKLNQRHAADVVQSIYFNGSDILFRSAPTGTAGSTPTFTELVKLRTDTGSANIGAFYPTANDRNNLGVGGLSWKNVYTVNAVTVTSDTRLKTWRDDGMTEAEVAAACAIALLGNWFQWTSRREVEGDDARWHFGYPAQDVARILMKHGIEDEQSLDFPPDRYIPESERPRFRSGFIGFDTWQDEEEGNRFSLRMEPLNAFVLAGMARKMMGA